MTTIAIVGVGLIGGSFALALRKAGFSGRILGVSSPSTLARATALRVIDEGLGIAAAAAQADVIYLSQPIAQILETLQTIDSVAKPGALITDAGSTKAAIMRAANDHIQKARFVGGHPMAGKESRGVESADPDLFGGRPYVLTERESWLVEWIERIGARLVLLDPEEHDRLVAITSHLPQLISTALARSIGEVNGSANVAGPAAQDLTRLALSPYDVWRDIFATNAGPIDAALALFIERLQALRCSLQDPAMERAFEEASAAARELRINR
jgi:prephenate dehydrogenase